MVVPESCVLVCLREGEHRRGQGGRRGRKRVLTQLCPGKLRPGAPEEGGKVGGSGREVGREGEEGAAVSFHPVLSRPSGLS